MAPTAAPVAEVIIDSGFFGRAAVHAREPKSDGQPNGVRVPRHQSWDTRYKLREQPVEPILGSRSVIEKPIRGGEKSSKELRPPKNRRPCCLNLNLPLSPTSSQVGRRPFQLPVSNARSPPSLSSVAPRANPPQQLALPCARRRLANVVLRPFGFHRTPPCTSLSIQIIRCSRHLIFPFFLLFYPAELHFSRVRTSQPHLSAQTP